jgi:chorismate dehydratase
MKLGYIDYLNCYPFYFSMFERQTVEAIRIYPGYPCMLNQMMADRRLDMSPVSSAACAQIADDVVVLPQFCLSSVGYVGSVILVSKIPIEDLNQKKVGITSASHTSKVLLKVLLKNYYHLEPVYVSSQPRPVLRDLDAALVIGNDAMAISSEPISYIYDLGDLWLRKTGFPVVFAVFAIRERVVEKYLSRIQSVISSYHLSLNCLEEEKENVVSKARAKYPDIIYDINGYFDLLKFEFDDELKKALMFYYTIAGEMGLLKKVKRLNYLTSMD